MRPGIVNIILGGLLCVGGLSGKLVLFGTSSSQALAVVGGLVLALGIYQFARSAKGS